MAAMVSSNLPNDISAKIHPLVDEFTNLAREILQKQNLNQLLMPMFKNHNNFIAIDSENLHAVYTTEGVTSAIVSGTERDLRNKGTFTQNQIADVCVKQLGYKDIHYFGFPIDLLDQTKDVRKPSLENIINQYIQSRIRPLIALANLGLTESMKYLQNAKARFDTKTAEGYADCKTNCRNALISCTKALTGQENLREGAKLLAKQGYFGEREEELIDSLGDLMSKLYNLASKKGPHPPLSEDEEDALLVLGMTENMLNYISKKALKKR